MADDKDCTSSKSRKQLSRANRTKLAKETINKTIPSLLASYPRARAGVASAQLLRIQHGPSPGKSTPKSSGSGPTIRVIESDTLNAAQAMHASHLSDRIAVLSMASPLRAGGGILTGATSQEESLCIRSTLLPSLLDQFYRLPEDAIVYTTDVLVFRNEDLAPLSKSDRYFVDVISCAAIRFPEVVNGKYVVEADREAMVTKVRMIMRAAVMKGCKRIALGALGCGAYANPPREVAKIFKRVLCGHPKRTDEEKWTSIEEVVFAIFKSQENIGVFSEDFKMPSGNNSSRQMRDISSTINGISILSLNFGTSFRVLR